MNVRGRGEKKNVRSSMQQRQRMGHQNTHTPRPGRQNSFTLKCAGMILLVTAIANTIIVATLPSHYGDYQLFYQLLMLVLLFYGYSSSVLLSSSAAHALLRRCSSKSREKERYKVERPIALASSMVGPLISIIIFAAVGNVYTIRNLQIVWYVGCGLEMLVGLLSLGFSERYQIIPKEAEDDVMSENSLVDSPRDEEQDVDARYNEVDDEEDVIDDSMRELQQKIDKVLVTEDDARQGRAAAESDAQRSSLMGETSLSSQSLSFLEGETAAALTRSEKPSSTEVINSNSPLSTPLTLLPPTLFVLLILLFVAGGALFHSYWPVFFKDNIPQLPPIQVQALYAIIPFILLLSDAAFQKITEPKKIAHRVAISMAAKSLGATFVILIGTASSLGGGGSSIALATLFTLRMVFMDSAEKVETVFAGYVSDNNIDTSIIWRNGMEMVNMIVWSVCAAVGGVIIESKSVADSGYGSGDGGGGYGYVLRLTGVVEFLGVVCMIMVVVVSHFGIGVKDTGS